MWNIILFTACLKDSSLVARPPASCPWCLQCPVFTSALVTPCLRPPSSCILMLKVISVSCVHLCTGHPFPSFPETLTTITVLSKPLFGNYTCCYRQTMSNLWPHLKIVSLDPLVLYTLDSKFSPMRHVIILVLYCDLSVFIESQMS